MHTILNIYKPIGITPLQLIHDLQQVQSEYANKKIGYAGRLDPLAHGVMLLMIGEATKHRAEFLDLEKVYEFEILFGVETDTYDMLGFVKKPDKPTVFVKENVNLFVKDHIKKQTQFYPPFSSKSVYGKPLFWWARQNRLSEITIPQRTIEITDFSVKSFGEISKTALQERIETTIAKVNGDFRQEETIEKWAAFFNESTKNTFQTAKFQIACSSGTYVRGLVHSLGIYLGCGASTLDILRTKVGDFTLETSTKLGIYS